MHTLKTVALASIVGGTILFIVAMLFHLGAYRGNLVRHFETPQKVADSVRLNAPTSGVYVLSTPAVLMSVKGHGKASTVLSWLKSWVTNVILALLASLLLLYYPAPMSYLKKLGLFVLIGLLVALASQASLLSKEYYPFHFAMYSMIAIFVGWFCAGLVMAKIVKH